MKGVTLIETLVYAALLSVLLWSLATLSIAAGDSAEHDAAALKEHEAWGFALRKVEWAVARATLIDASPRELRIRSIDDSLDPIRFRVRDGALTLASGGGNETPIMLLAEGDSVQFEERGVGFLIRVTAGDVSIEREYFLP